MKKGRNERSEKILRRRESQLVEKLSRSEREKAEEERELSLLSKTYSPISIVSASTDKKLLFFRHKIDERVTTVLNEWFSSGSEELHIFMASAAALRDVTLDTTIDIRARAGEYKVLLDSGDKVLYDNIFRLFTLMTVPLSEPISTNSIERIEELIKVKFMFAISTTTTGLFPEHNNSIDLIPDNVKYALKIKILLDFYYMKTRLDITQIVQCDLSLKRGRAGLLHKDSSNYGPKFLQMKSPSLENVEYVSLLTLTKSETLMKGTQLVVDDIDMPFPIPDKILVGLPVKFGSNTIFYDPAFLHCTPEAELIDEVQVEATKMIEDNIPYSVRKAKSMHLSEEEKRDIMGSLKHKDRSFIRCHYTPITGSQITYEQLDIKGEFDGWISESNKIPDAQLAEILKEYIITSERQYTVSGPEAIVSNPVELNNALKELEKGEMSIGGKRRTQKLQKLRKRLITKKHTKKRVNLKFNLPKSNSVVIDANENFKNGGIYCENDNIYSILRCYTGNTIVY
jgi:hypothetical protein